MFKIVYFIVFFTGVSSQHYISELSHGRVVVFDRILQKCDEYKNISNDYTLLINYKNSMTFDFNLNIPKTIPSDLVCELKVEKCTSREAPDSCVKMANFKTGQYCSIIGSEDQVWSPFTGCITPKYECPIKKNIYKGRNCSLGMKAFRMFPLGNYYWIVKTLIFSKRTRKPEFCFIFAGSVRRKTG